MAFYDALQNSTRRHNGDYANGNIVLVKNGFCWPALFFAPLWLIFRGMWLILVFYIGISMLLIAIAELGFISPDTAFWVDIAFAFLLAFEGNFLRKWTLQRSNYQQIGVSFGKGLQQAEVNFFEKMQNATHHASDHIGQNTHNYDVHQNIIVKDKPQTPAQITKPTHWKSGGKRNSDSVVGMF